MADQVEVYPPTDAPKNDAPKNNAPQQQTPPPEPSRPPEPRSPESRRRLIVVLVVILLVLGVAGFFVWRYLDTYESTDDAQVDGHVNSISARVGGYVTAVNIEDNQYVEKGAVLVQIDPRDYQVAVDHARAELADAEATARALSLNVPVETVGTTSLVSSSEAQLTGTQAGVTAAQKQFDAARSQLQEAEANNARAQSDLARYRQLVAKDEVSQQVYEQADAAAKASAAAVDAARASAAGAEQQIAQAQGRLGQAEAALRNSRTGPQQVNATRARAQAAVAAANEKRAQLAQAELNLEYCTIAAPVSGVVNKNVEVGMNVQPGQTLLSIVPLEDVWVTADFKETQLANMHPGQRATISVDAFSRKYDGHVESIAGAAGARFSLLPPENATGNYVKVVQRVPVKIVIDPGQNQDHRLRLGMSVEPKVWVK